jgi:hypothetical protein
LFDEEGDAMNPLKSMFTALVLLFSLIDFSITPAHASCAEGFGRDEWTLDQAFVVVARVEKIENSRVRLAVLENWKADAIESELVVYATGAQDTNSGDSEATSLAPGVTYLLGFDEDGILSACLSVEMSYVEANLKPTVLGTLLVGKVRDFTDGSSLDSKNLFVGVLGIIVLVLIVVLRKTRKKSAENRASHS